MTTIRDRQNMEMLDVWKNLNSQVFDRTKRQIAVFPQSVKPKTERDLTVEVNTDKSIEQLNKTFESKLAALEYLVQLLQVSNAVAGFEGLVKKEDAGAFAQLYQATINTGEVIPIWNQIVRYYQQQGLSKDSQEIVKVKTQELKPNLDALTYGIRKAVDFIFENKQMNAGQALKVMELLRALSIYTMIMSQVDDGSLGLISNFELDTAYKNSFSSLSSNELEILKLYAPRGSITTSAIRNIPDFSTTDSLKRIRQIENELGIRLPADYSKTLRQLPISELNKEADKLLQEKGSIKKVLEGNAKELKYREKSRQLYRDKYKLEQADKQLAEEYSRISAELEELTNATPDDKNYTQEEVPEEPIEPEQPDFDENTTEEEWFDRELEYQTELEEFNNLNEERNAIIARNELNKEIAEAKSQEALDEKIKEKTELLSEAQDEYSRIWNEIETIKDAIKRLADKTKGVREDFMNSVIGNLERLDSKRRPLKPTIQAQAEELGRERMGQVGQGKDVDTRGLASLRSNYGKPESESDSESEEEESESDLDFDDSRNEHYYTKPKSMR